VDEQKWKINESTRSFIIHNEKPKNSKYALKEELWLVELTLMNVFSFGQEL